MQKHVFIILSICTLAMVSAQGIPYFDGEKSYGYLKEQCNFGPRYPGTEAHEALAAYLQKFLEPLADELQIMTETVEHPMHKKPVQLTNLFARFNPDAEFRILFLAHWDTREIADQDTVPANQSKPIIGANDGASGIAVLMSLAQILHDNPVEIGVDLLFEDGEDMGVAGDLDSWGLGTREFAKKMQRPYPQYAVCLDMVGDAQQEFLIEPYSYMQAPAVVQKIWKIAGELGYTQFKDRVGKAIIDDHRILWEVTKIPAVDIIDFEYPEAGKNYWHTLEDTADKCSAASLEAVGTVMTTLIYMENARNRP
ncbi:MAG: M28 family peptidase [FCB group bacterium]|nr:M28 family peptidase [FCB group bacterium]